MNDHQHRNKSATSRRPPEPWQAALCSVALGLLIGAAIVALGVWGSGKL